MKSPLITAFLLIFSSGFANATDFVMPHQTLSGAENPYDYGDLVVLSVSKITSKPEHWISSSTNWKVFDALIAQDGKTITFKEKKYLTGSSGEIILGTGIVQKKMVAIATTTHLYTVKDDKGVIGEIGTRTNSLMVEITIGSSPAPIPPPGPTPNPSPGPSPVLPDGQYKLAAFAYTNAMSGVTNNAHRAAAAKALATAFRGQASAIDAGTIADVQGALTKMKSSNALAVTSAGGTRDEWLPFFTALQDNIFNLYNGQQISGVADFSTAWKEIANGLDQVK